MWTNLSFIASLSICACEHSNLWAILSLVVLTLTIYLLAKIGSLLVAFGLLSTTRSIWFCIAFSWWTILLISKCLIVFHFILVTNWFSNKEVLLTMGSFHFKWEIGQFDSSSFMVAFVDYSPCYWLYPKSLLFAPLVRIYLVASCILHFTHFILCIHSILIYMSTLYIH